MNIADYLRQITELTNTNLELLKALNDSLYTNQTHLSVNLGDEGIYAIPSFISLENKINELQDNFENLVNAPVTSEAYFTFNGNSRAIQVKGYEQSPAPLVLDGQTTFYSETNNMLKDFLTPSPYLKFDVNELPNDITSVNIRKVSAKSETAKNRFSSLLGEDSTKSINWGDIKKTIDDLEDGVDYILYDTTKSLPIRKGQGSGTYVIREIIDDVIDNNLDEHVTIRLANDIDGFQKTLSYLLFDQTIERDLEVGQYLVAWDGHVKFEIEELNFNTNVIKLRVMYGSFLDLTTYDGDDPSDIDDSAKIRFFSESDLFEDDKYVKVTLEEDQYVFVAIAPINPRMNIRASWGTGLLINTDLLTNADGVNFRQYYNDNCVNIGDILSEISKVMSNTVSSHSNSELNQFMTAVPVIDTDIIKVTHINKHLDESPTIKNIKALYSQKNLYNSDLTETQNSITNLQNQLSSVDFQDTSGIRANLQAQINTLTTHKNELTTSLMKICDEISLAANESTVPIENAKYRIRGFFDFNSFVNKLLEQNSDLKISGDNIKGIAVQYRYRNPQLEVGAAQTFVSKESTEEQTFVFSDWNSLYTPLRPRVRKSDGEYGAEEDNSNKNEPSFNQIDIPITQGEEVDVRLKVIYDYGYPFIQMTSEWSAVTTFKFPEEFIKDVEVLDIIKENNDDIEANRFTNILTSTGVISHVDDKIMDQDKTYFHKPESISSGFVTPEQRIIPLRDKLLSMDNNITLLLDEVMGSVADQLSVKFNYDNSSISINPFEKGHVLMKEFSYFASIDMTGVTSKTDGNYIIYADSNNDQYRYVATACSIKLTNISSHSIRLFSLFPGTSDTPIDDLEYAAFNPEDYSGIRIDSLQPGGTRELTLQTTNQFITFRNNDPYDGTKYYEHIDSPYILESNILQSYVEGDDNYNYYQLTPYFTDHPDHTKGMCVYPATSKVNGLLMTSREAYTSMILAPNDELVIPIMVEYSIPRIAASVTNLEKTIAFDIRTSLYKDPAHYAITIGAKWEGTPQDKQISTMVENNTISTFAVKNNKFRTIVK